ncbi:hypothetical protein ACS5PJ_11000 [Pseudarthrobacter sp. YS3]|uniref:hypothetical protein n=1 Tax=Pseudarthrobacter sp. YS3 TaxID=3453718 RepID=UPI003EE9865D
MARKLYATDSRWPAGAAAVAVGIYGGGASMRGETRIRASAFALWVPVLNEQQALLVLASHGVAAGGASGGAIRGGHRQSIRLAIGRQLERPDEVADLYAMASRAL